ncbi:hypothetical protein [Candidatus Burkholderia verschuerenii]|nr:hypothetical protein [Candidatus Burkholderia verschuerenii]
MQAFGTMPVRGQFDANIGGYESSMSLNKKTRRADTTPRTHEAS